VICKIGDAPVDVCGHDPQAAPRAAASHARWLVVASLTGDWFHWPPKPAGAYATASHKWINDNANFVFEVFSDRLTNDSRLRLIAAAHDTF
jgi:hypothetical protein